MADAPRTAIDYASAAPAAPGTFAGFDVDAPVPGYYRMRLNAAGVDVGIRIWFGPPKDPVTGEELDRSHRWQAEANGRPIDLDRVWPVCAKNPIDEAQHDYLASLQRWGAENGHEALADPRRPLSPLHSPMMF